MSGWLGCLGKAATGRKLLTLTAAGVLGDLAVSGVRRVSGGHLAKKVAVKAIAGGIVLTRRLESAAEEARLKAGDLVAEARQSLGEEAAPPVVHEATEHQH